jgi:hypothetical protein
MGSSSPESAVSSRWRSTAAFGPNAAYTVSWETPAASAIAVIVVAT